MMKYHDPGFYAKDDSQYKPPLSKQPDIDDLSQEISSKIYDLITELDIRADSYDMTVWAGQLTDEILKALYHRLAAEAVTMVDLTPLTYTDKAVGELALPLSKLKAIMEIKES